MSSFSHYIASQWFHLNPVLTQQWLLTFLFHYFFLNFEADWNLPHLPNAWFFHESIQPCQRFCVAPTMVEIRTGRRVEIKLPIKPPFWLHSLRLSFMLWRFWDSEMIWVLYFFNFFKSEGDIFTVPFSKLRQISLIVFKSSDEEFSMNFFWSFGLKSFKYSKIPKCFCILGGGMMNDSVTDSTCFYIGNETDLF